MVMQLCWGRNGAVTSYPVAAKKVILQADYIVDTDCMRQYPNLVRIPDFLVEAVVYAPMGVWPACSTGCYDSDEEHFYYMNSMLKTEEGTKKSMLKSVCYQL